MSEVVKERDIWVHSFRMPPDSNNSIKMEVGIEDCLHIEFEYNKSKFVGRNHLSTQILTVITQVSSKGCDRRKDLLPARTHQN
jgi:vacuolar protein sorting-associated protein 26